MPKDLHVGFSALSQSVRFVHVALVKCGTWKQAQMLQENIRTSAVLQRTMFIEILEFHTRWRQKSNIYSMRKNLCPFFCVHPAIPVFFQRTKHNKQWIFRSFLSTITSLNRSWMMFVCQTHFCIIYTLVSGAELFGGAPSEQSAWKPELQVWGSFY